MIALPAHAQDDVISRDKGKDDTGTWGTDTMTFQDDELSYALGKQGGTRKKLERSSGAIVQYVGHNALFSGTRSQRKKAREYMKWLFEQLEGPMYVEGPVRVCTIAVVKLTHDCMKHRALLVLVPPCGRARVLKRVVRIAEILHRLGCRFVSPAPRQAAHFGSAQWVAGVLMCWWTLVGALLARPRCGRPAACLGPSHCRVHACAAALANLSVATSGTRFVLTSIQFLFLHISLGK